MSELPRNWVKVAIEECCRIVQGQSPPGDTYNARPHGLPFFQGKAEFGDLYPTARKWCSDPRKIAETDDVLVSVRAPVGPTNLCPTTACIGRGLAAIRPLAGIPTKYVMYALRESEALLKSKATGSTFEAISGDDLRRHPISVAPLQEQQRIVDEIEKQLTRLDAAVAALKRVQGNLKRYRAAVLKAACEGRLVPTEAELARREGRQYETGEQLLARILQERRAKWEADQLARMTAAGKPPKDDSWKRKYKEPKSPAITGLPSPPVGWMWASLEQLSVLITSGSRGWAAYYSNDGPLFIRAQDIRTDKLDVAQIAHVNVPATAEGSRTRVFLGDLLITITGANVTKSALLNFPIGEAYVSQHVGLVRASINKIAPFLYFWIVSPAHGRGGLEEVAYGAGKPGLNLDNLGELPIALPPLAEQERINIAVGAQLTIVDETQKQLQANINGTEILHESILKRAFEGKLVPQDPNDEPASVLLERIRAERAEKSKTSNPGRSSRSRRKRAEELVV